MTDEEIKELFKAVTGFEPYDYQWQKAAPAILGNKNASNNVIVAVGTGSGKTEAAFVPALDTGRRIILLLPAKSLLQDQLKRVGKLAEAWAAYRQKPVPKISVDTGDEDERTFYTADIIVTSLDKFLFRMFAYGRRRFGYLYPYRIGLTQERPALLILDEAHTYEEVIFSHFWFVLQKLTYERRAQTVLLSATLPDKLVAALQDKARIVFPRPADEPDDFFYVVTDKAIRSGRVFYQGTLNTAEGLPQAWDAYKSGERVIVVVRRVVPEDEEAERNGDTLQEIWGQWQTWADHEGQSNELAHASPTGVSGSILTYHGHQMPDYRRKVLDQLKALDDPRKPYLLLTTSAMEVGVDISATVMFTQLCEPDAFVQRIGRCARRKGEEGQVFVLHDPNRKAARGTAELRQYLETLKPGDELDAQRKKALNDLNRPPNLARVPLRLEYLQDQKLYSYVYDFVRENKGVWERGLLVTREWEPSVTLVLSEQYDGETYIGGIPAKDFWWGKELKTCYSLPVSGAASIAQMCTWIFDAYDTDYDAPRRIAVGGEKERTLGQALQKAGYENVSGQSNQIELCAMGLPLLLLPHEKLHEVVNPDANIGFTYHARFTEPKSKWSPSPLLRKQAVKLTKKQGGIELYLWWFEPRTNDTDEEGE
jgi:CRISPR-associated endonuclease/helicase Cas3